MMVGRGSVGGWKGSISSRTRLYSNLPRRIFESFSGLPDSLVGTTVAVSLRMVVRPAPLAVACQLSENGVAAARVAVATGGEMSFTSPLQ